jgi:hypothetical protein
MLKVDKRSSGGLKTILIRDAAAFSEFKLKVSRRATSEGGGVLATVPLSWRSETGIDSDDDHQQTVQAAFTPGR